MKTVLYATFWKDFKSLWRNAFTKKKELKQSYRSLMYLRVVYVTIKYIVSTELKIGLVGTSFLQTHTHTYNSYTSVIPWVYLGIDI